MIAVLLAASVALAPAPQSRIGEDMTFDVFSERYSDGTRDAEDKMKEVLYVDLDGRGVDYANLDEAKIDSISTELRAAHRPEIEAFTETFVHDEIAAGASEAEARERAAAYVDDYFEALWDVQIDLAGEARDWSK